HPTNAAYCATGYCFAGPGPGRALESARAAAAEVALAVKAEASVARAVSLGYPRPARPYPGAEHDAAACREAGAEAHEVERGCSAGSSATSSTARAHRCSSAGRGASLAIRPS